MMVEVTAAAAQTAPCKIIVKDSAGEPVIGAAAYLKGDKTNGGVADIDGAITFGQLPNDAVIVVTCLGFQDKEVKVAGQKQITVTMESQANVLEELVVVGYGTQRKKDLSGAIAKVDSELLSEFPTVSAANALQGRVSGVQVLQNNGAPGATVQIRVRGANSIVGDNEPLWIVNGFPSDAESVNSSDIESIEILKDASATAIYGSRGANGVVIVTTKGAKEGKIRVNYDGSFGVQTVTKELPMLNAWDYMNYLNEKNAINGLPPMFTQSQINDNKYTTDWQYEVFRPAFTTDHSVHIAGGTSKVSAGVGLSYFKQDGIIQNSGYDKFSINADVKYNISRIFSVNAGLIYTTALQRQMNSQGGGRGSTVMNSMLLASPLATPHYDDGTWNDFQLQPLACTNPVAYLNEVKSTWHTHRLLANAGLTIRPFDGFSIQATAAVRDNISRTDYFKSLNYPASLGAASINFGNVLDITSNNIISYDKFFAGKHHINAMVGATYETYVSKPVATGTAENFLSDVAESYDLDAAKVKGLPTSSFSDWRLLSFLGRVNYNYDDRYLVTVNFRADGSSRYSKGNKWGFFPSAAFAWRLSRESFMKGASSWLSDLKIRASYGQTGNTAISPYQTMNTLSTNNVIFNRDIAIAYCPEDKFVGDLKWEKTSQVNGGLDASLFNGRLTFTMDGYYKLTTDLLNDVEMPRSSGYTKALRNIGSVSNAGFELQMDGRIIDREFKWDMGVNLTVNRSRVVSLADHNDIFGSTISNSIISGQLNLMREGYPMYLFYGYVEDGYDSRGRLQYKDLDGDGKISEKDRDIIGNPNPDCLLNFNVKFSWKGISLGAFFQSSIGNDIYSLTIGSLAYDYGYNGNVLKDLYGNWWTPENPEAKYPSLLSNQDLKLSDRFVYDGSFLRLKNLELGYDFPLKAAKYIKKAKVYLSAQNLFTISSYPLWDPDMNSKGGGSSMVQGVDNSCYPSARVFLAGVRLGF